MVAWEEEGVLVLALEWLGGWVEPSDIETGRSKFK